MQGVGGVPDFVWIGILIFVLLRSLCKIVEPYSSPPPGSKVTEGEGILEREIDKLKVKPLFLRISNLQITLSPSFLISSGSKVLGRGPLNRVKAGVILFFFLSNILF